MLAEKSVILIYVLIEIMTPDLAIILKSQVRTTIVVDSEFIGTELR